MIFFSLISLLFNLNDLRIIDRFNFEDNCKGICLWEATQISGSLLFKMSLRLVIILKFKLGDYSYKSV